MLNAIAAAYVKQNVSRRSEEAEHTLAFLNQELPKLRAQLEVSEQSLNVFRNEKKTIDIPGEIKELLTQATTLEKSRLELDLKRREYATRFQPDYPLLKSVNSQLAEVKDQTTALNQHISQLPQVQQDYIRKARDVEVNNQLYVSLLNNAQQLQVAKAGTVGNVAVVDPAIAPERPARPNKPLTVAIGSLLGLLIGFVVCQALAFLTGVVRDPKKLEAAIGLPILAILPLSLDQADAIEMAQSIKDSGNHLGPTGNPPAYMLAKEQPTAIAVESLRSLRTSLLFALSEKPRGKVLLMTSAVPSQGKSFLSANLAYLFAAMGKKVLLIEADVRRASLKRYIDFNSLDPGLSSILREGYAPESVVLQNVYENLDFLPAGPRVKNPGDMLSTDAMQQLIHDSAEKYDYVVIDSPPLLPVHDARALATASDVTVFVVRQDMTSISEVREAIDICNKSGSKIDGLVFNGFIPSRIRYGYGYGYGYSKGYKGKYRKYGYRRYGYGYKPYQAYDKYMDDPEK
jgi:tyrosine-protein kinase Etk/Wzc